MRTLLLLVCSLVLWSAPARAESSVGVVVIGDPTVQPQLAAQLEDWLRTRGNVLVPSPLPAESINALIDCFVVEDLGCARTIVEKSAKAPQVVFAKIELSDATSGMRDVTITAYWFETGADPIAVRRSCASCTDAALRALTDELMSSLAGKGRAEVGTISVTSVPAGARVVIDGTEAGVTPLTATVAPGAHTFTLRLAGHIDARGDVSVARGETTAVAVVLTRASPSRSKLPLAGLGLGGAVLVTGIVLYATSEEDTGEKPEYRDTRVLGVTLGVVGLAVAGVSAYYLLRDDSPSEGPVVSIGPGGAYVGWGRQF